MIEPSRWAVASHESRHAAYGTYAGLTVLSIHVGRVEGRVEWADGVTPEKLRGFWHADQHHCLRQTQAVVGSIIAPVACEGKRFAAVCDDTQELQRYARAWAQLRPSSQGITPPKWLDVLRQTHDAVHAWATQPGAFMALATLATYLADNGTTDSEGFAWLWAQPWCTVLHRNAASASSLRTVPPVPHRQSPVVPNWRDMLGPYGLTITPFLKANVCKW